MKRIGTLVPGDEVVGWMKTGLALSVKRDQKGVAFLKVPSRPSKAGSGDITTWVGIVTGNAAGRLSVALTKRNYLYRPVGQGFVADIPYFALYRLFLYSETHIQPTLPPPSQYDQLKFGGVLRPFRTLTKVLIK